MSFRSVADICEQEGLNPTTMSEETARSVLWRACQRDLPKGVAVLRKLAASAHAATGRIVGNSNIDEETDGQVKRLLGADAARAVCELELGVAFGFFNCHAPVAAPSRELLQVTAREQIMFQNGMIAQADC